MTGITIAVGTGAFAPNSFVARDTGAQELAHARQGGIEIVRAQP